MADELEYEFEDVLTAATIKCSYPGMQALRVSVAESQKQAETIFFPGCSFLNYGLPLVGSVKQLLEDSDIIQGTSLLCCGKILQFEPDGKALRENFEAELREHLLASGVKKIITACPNCTKSLRGLLSADERTAGIEVKPLPLQLADMGYKIDSAAAQNMVAQQYIQSPGAYETDASAMKVEDIRLSIHDACPDRDMGEFAEGMRRLLDMNIVHEMAHIKNKSLCCGSLVRAAGKYDASMKQSITRGNEAQEAQTQAMVTPCVSCTYLLNAQQNNVPVFHYLELLYNWRIPWASASEYMKFRFLFEGSFGLFDENGDPVTNNRPFVGLER